MGWRIVRNFCLRLKGEVGIERHRQGSAGLQPEDEVSEFGPGHSSRALPSVSAKPTGTTSTRVMASSCSIRDSSMPTTSRSTSP